MYFKPSDIDQLLWRVSLVLFALMVAAQLLLAVDRSPSADDALFLSVPKNWLNGYGWATSYSEKIPFNPDFTGPTALLIPAALLIKLFGHQLWIASVTGLTFNTVLIALCLQQIRSYWKHHGLASLCLVTGCIISKPEDVASLVGYYSGSLLVVLLALLAFNPRHSITKRAIGIGVLAAIGLHIKWLLAPALVLSICLFILSGIQQKTISARHAVKPLLLLLLPVLVLHGSWQLYKNQTMANYSEAYQAAWNDYGDQFFEYHGSGIGQWREAKDKIVYLTFNANRNLYFVEESLAEYGVKNPFLGNAPADEHHIIGFLLIAALIFFVFSLTRNIMNAREYPAHWHFLTMTLISILYLGWFIIFSMSMSPGHFYFQNQWLLWTALLAFSQNRLAVHKPFQIVISIALSCLSLLSLYKLDSIPLPKVNQQLLAADYIQKTTFDKKLAGCGYGGYPRHLEYLLPDSQNFNDCLDLISDHVAQENGVYRWLSPISFYLIFSLQTPGFNPATSKVISACKDNVIYFNHEVAIVKCNFPELEKINLGTLMEDIKKEHNWYRTRIQP